MTVQFDRNAFEAIRQEKIHRELSLLNDINDIILRTSSEEELFTAVCRCIVNSGGYKLAWICLHPGTEPEAMVVPLAAYGQLDYLEKIRIFPNDPEQKNGPTASAMNSGATVITNNVTRQPHFKPWLERAMHFGIAASLGIGLNFGNNQRGALNIYSSFPNAFDHQEVAVLERLARNLSLAVKNIRTEQKKTEAEYLLAKRVLEISTLYRVSYVLQNEMGFDPNIFEKISCIILDGLDEQGRSGVNITYKNAAWTAGNFDAEAPQLSNVFQLVDGSSGLLQVSRKPVEKGSFVFPEEQETLLHSLARNIEQIVNNHLRETAVFEANKRFRLAFESAAIGMALVSLAGQFTMVNRELCNMLGYEPEELVQLRFTDITHPEDIATTQSAFIAMNKAAQKFYRTEKRYLHKNGKTVWINLNVSMLTDTNGAPLYHIAQMENVTASKLARQQLIHSEANLQTIFKSTETGYMLINKSFVIEAFNQRLANAFLFITGHKLEVGQSYISLLQPSRRQTVQQMLEKLLETNEPYEYELRVDKETEIRFYRIKGYPVFDRQNVIGICISGLEITGEKQRNEERERLISDLEKRNEDLQHFTQILSHNIRGPLSTIRGLGALLTKELTASEKDYLIDGILASSDRMDNVVRDFNRILEIKRGVTDKKQLVNLASVLEQVKLKMQASILQNEVTIQSDFSAMPTLYSWETAVYDILFCLVENAIKFRKTTVKLVINIQSFSASNTACITLQDNGEGFDADRYGDTLFELSHHINFRDGGRGLGLFLVKMQIELLNGTIEVKSKRGEGSIFTCMLPLET